MTSSPPVSTCPACGVAGTGNFCSSCGASLLPRSCDHCRAPLSPQARFCHRCGRSVTADRTRASECGAWLFACAMSLLLVGAIVYQVVSKRPAPAAPDMANAGSVGPEGPSGPAPDISRMTPRERFDRLFNRIMQAAERGDSGQIARFTPMALAAYDQLDSVDADARYHVAVLRLQTGDVRGARMLADTILANAPGHLFGYLIRGTAAQMAKDPAALSQAQADFLAHYDQEMGSKRVEYLEHKPVIEAFKNEAETAR
jgi:Double zinc ribbon